ncbi:hypothetical protein IFM89_024473 [Coptis chinensis]|uniref:Uncharacterized protein n=1 Tax=Coptis chinensis TaxID=261450 RepID=A0A835H5L1_9MAGN|nr:hypothetical protein IFM89_024473 [Coptis chinensis]
MPSEGASPFFDSPPLPTFNADEFLESLSTRGAGKFLSKRMRANWLDLYRRFLKGHNFMPWFERRPACSLNKNNIDYGGKARSRGGIQQYLLKMSELEIVDSFNLKGDLQAVFKVLPKDMQQLLLFNPQTAALLQGETFLNAKRRQYLMMGLTRFFDHGAFVLSRFK